MKRLVLAVCLALAASVVLVPGAAAAPFDGERMGCLGEDPMTCPPGTVGQSYSLTIYLLPRHEPRGEDFDCATFHHTSGAFPPGLSISRQGVFHGTPTQAGTYDFYVTVKYDKEPGCAKTPSDQRLIIEIKAGLAKLTIGPESAAPGTTGEPYSHQMTATVPEPKTWSINAGTLPPGLAIDASSGLISGTPTAAGRFDFQVLAKMASDSRSDTKWLGILVRDPVTVVADDPFTPARRALAQVGVDFEATLAVTGGSGVYTWAVSGELPPGLTLADGILAGRPTVAGVYRFTVSVSDSEGRVAAYAARILVAERLTVATLLLRPGKVGKLYRAKLAAAGGVKPTTWKVVRGPLPRGIRLDRTRGILYGVPKKAGTSRILVEATDALGVTATKLLRLKIAAAAKPKRKPQP